jgi:pheromone shutdown protein TraB
MIGIKEYSAMLLVLDMCMLVAFAANTTASLSTLKTWWHATGEINTKTPVQNGNVRQSHMYSIQVATAKDPLHTTTPSSTKPYPETATVKFVFQVI